MRMSLLQMTQSILSSMDSDEINSINDTVESQQVVDIIQQCFNDIVSQVDFPEHWDLFELQPSLDPDRPTLMYIPENVARVEWIKYDKAPLDGTAREIRDVFPMERQTFLNRMNGLDTADTTVKKFNFLVGAETFDIRVKNNKHPDYYTTFDNRTLLFDSFDLSVSTTLEADKTECYGMLIPTFERLDDFVPAFEPRQFTLLFNEAKSQCFSELKQVTNAKAEQRARRGWVYSAKKKQNTKASEIRDPYPSYGRGRRK